MSSKAQHRKRRSASHQQDPPTSRAIEEMALAKEPEILKAAAAHPGMNEDLALAFLTRRDLPPAALEALAKNGSAMKHRRVMAAIVAHVKTPRHVSLPMARHLYTFELLQIVLTPAVPADVKMAVEDAITM